MLYKCIVKWILDQDQEYVTIEEAGEEVAARKHQQMVEGRYLWVGSAAKKMRGLFRREV